ncbi:MAG: hypothetical protein Q8R29_00810 [bacterium]|nr:hypothetical protein [bacterium]
MFSAILALGLAAGCLVVAFWMAFKHFRRSSFVDKDAADKAVKETP